jgi:hypothetical protein
MIYEANIHTRKKLVSMFEGFNNVVLLSYLQGHMGTAWVNKLKFHNKKVHSFYKCR